jgi:DNA-directed RNA polymerase subunit RPC12/RpoP
MNMGISEKVAYLKGLAEGLSLDESTKEGKLLLAILDVLDDMAEEFADIEDEIVDLEDGLDAVSDDLNDVEEFLYETSDDEDEEDEEDDDEYFVTTCPECEEEVIFDESVLEDGEVVCPNCGAKLEFDLSDLANATGADEEDED